MIATTVIGNGYVSCVVVHIFRSSTANDPLVTRANLLSITAELTWRGDYQQTSY